MAVRNGQEALLVALAAVGIAACTDTAPLSPLAERDTGSMAPAAGASFTVATSSEIQIVSSIAPDRCLEVKEGKLGNGTPLVLGQCSSNSPRQYFRWVGEEIRFGELCVDAAGRKGRDGDRIRLWSCDGGSNQKWRSTAAGEIRGIADKCMDVYAKDSRLGTPIHLWTCDGGSSQRWTNKATSTGTETVPASVTIAPSSVALNEGASATLSATVRDASGNILGDAQVSWSSSDAAVAGVSGSGVVAGMRAGSAMITASSGGKSASASVQVLAPLANECANPKSGWIFCDDFDQDRLSRYFEFATDNGSFARVSGVGNEGSTGMRARFAAGQVSAGSLKLAFGRTPDAYMRPADAGTANYREVYWRVYLRNEPTWTGGGGDKLSRAIVFANAQWAEAAKALLWSGSADSGFQDYLILEPVSGTDPNGVLKSTKYNDFANQRYLGYRGGTTPIFSSPYVGKWYCVEAHVRLNDAGQSNGVFEFWIDGKLEAARSDLNWLGSYNEYGINSVFLENYWNSGSPKAQERYMDNFVVSTRPIGCGR